jgi:hypothetical protein
LEAQFFVDRGLSKKSGFAIIYTMEIATAIKLYQPIQTRLHTETASNDGTLKRVQTLSGFAWRIQCSPLSPNSLATLPPWSKTLSGSYRPSRLGRVTASASIRRVTE